MTHHPEPTNAAKAQVWQRYRDRQPERVPVLLATNPRIILLDSALNPAGHSFEDAAHDPAVQVEIALRHALHRVTCLNHFTDDATGLPEAWDVGLNVQNVYEAACFGCPIEYRPDQVPDTAPVFSGRPEAILEVDVEHPLETPFVRHNLALWQKMERYCRDLRWEGRPVRLHPWALTGTDGPVTVACNLCGTEFLTLLAAEPELADRIMAHIVRAAILRRQAFAAHWGDRVGLGAGMADDSVALIGTAMYRERVLPHHRAFYDSCPPGPRGMHLCGDATRHFPLLHQELGVTSFDTGFPVDHGALRRQLGPDVEILGGPPVSLLLQGTPEQVFTACRDILLSGVKEGGRFVLREGNNLPPKCPPANLEAMYQASLEYGRYP